MFVAGVAVLIYTPVIASLGRLNLAGVMAAVRGTNARLIWSHIPKLYYVLHLLSCSILGLLYLSCS